MIAVSYGKLFTGVFHGSRAASGGTFRSTSCNPSRQQSTGCFAQSDDFRYYLSCLRWAKSLYSCRLYAYVLMTNHVHLLLEPEGFMDLGGLMKVAAGRYTRYMNKRYGRTGTLWEGRFRSSLVEGERYLMAVTRYIEMNPVRTGMVEHPSDYPWSSYRAHAGIEPGGLLDWDPWYEGLGVEISDRRKAYKTWMEESVPEREWETIRVAVRRSGLLGGKRFLKQIAALLGREIKNRPPGRPRTPGK